MAVQKFIQDTQVSLVNHDLHNAASPKKPSSPTSNPQAENPVMALHQLLQTNNGAMEAEAYETEDKRWQVRIVARFNDKSLPFSHARTSNSKQKAKTEAARDMLTYLSDHPDVCQYLQVAVEGAAADTHVLPISESDYCHLFAVESAARSALKTSEWSGQSANLSQTTHEEATQLLENLFLGSSSMDVDTDPRQIKRQRQSTQGLGSSSSSDAINTEPLDQQPPQNASQGNVTYIKDEETFQPFNQPMEQPIDEVTTTRQEKIVKYFRKLFATHRLVLLKCRTEPGQSKTVFLSFVVQHQDELLVDIAIQQGGDSHTPLFHAKVVLRSKTKPNAFLTTEGCGRKKKDAEQQAFNKMIEIVTNWNAMI